MSFGIFLVIFNATRIAHTYTYVYVCIVHMSCSNHCHCYVIYMHKYNGRVSNQHLLAKLATTYYLVLET